MILMYCGLINALPHLMNSRRKCLPILYELYRHIESENAKSVENAKRRKIS